MFCEHCNFELKESVRFCTQCGKAVPVKENNAPASSTLLPDEEGVKAPPAATSRHFPRWIGVVASIALLAAALWFALAPRYELGLSVSNDGRWDQLLVMPVLENRPILGGSHQAASELTRVTVMNSAGKVLTRSQSPTLGVPDAALESGENLQVEACVRPLDGGGEVCATSSVQASPKRVVAGTTLRIAWPLTLSDYRLAAYQLSLVRQREVFGTKGEWEDLAPVSGTMRIEAAVQGAMDASVVLDATADGTVYRASLDQGSGFERFQAAMDRALSTGKAVPVEIRLFHGTENGAAAVALSETRQGARWFALENTRAGSILTLERDFSSYRVHLYDLLRGDVYSDIRQVSVDWASGKVDIDFSYMGGTRVSLSLLGKNSFEAWGSYPISLPVLGVTNVKVMLEFNPDGTADGEWSNMGLSGVFEIVRK